MKKKSFPWPAAAALALAGALLLEYAAIERAKSAQLLPASQLGPRLPRAEMGPPLAMASNGEGGLWLLDAREGGWRLRGFDPQFELKGSLQGAGVPPVALAVNAAGEALLAFEDGRALLAGADLARFQAVKGLPLSGIRAMHFNAQGLLVILQLRAKSLSAFALRKGALEKADLPLAHVPLDGAYSFAPDREGGAVLLHSRKGVLEARSVDSRGRHRAWFKPGIEANSTHAAAVDGQGRVYFSENVAGLGLSVWTLSGRYLGRATHAGEALLHSQFLLCAEPGGKAVYVLSAAFLGRFEVRA